MSAKNIIKSLSRPGHKKAGRRAHGVDKADQNAVREKRQWNKDNLRALRWLWLFPVGLPLMWDKRCSWNRIVKIAISACMAAILFIGIPVVVRHFDSLDQKREGGIIMQTYTGDPVAEVYGPSLPPVIVRGYTNEQTGSILTEDAQTEEVHYVYASKNQKRYHEYECKFAYASSQRMTVYEAYYLGYRPCGLCNPPAYTPGDELAVASQANQTENP